MSEHTSAAKRNHTWEEAFRKVQNFSITPGLNSFINPFSLLKLGDTDGVVQKIDHLYVDGISLVKFMQYFLGRKIERYSFDDSSIAPQVFRFVKEQNLPLAIIGTSQEKLEKSVAILEKRYGFRVAYYRNGFFENRQQRREVLEHIRHLGCQVVVCGMGTPLQEQVLIELSELGWRGYGYTCGGYLHQLATKEKYYPPFFDKLNIRWVYRIWDEPKLFHRYFVLYPTFALYFFHYLLTRRR
ncbi:WecB/TagA/CpsF family glycosyltransferase [Cesiribacter andamanensis]|uniref:Putative UDP-N-acetyl-D-mannosaminuronic acid transferase n=1 Tax=Cesiribacter andamanensis AMV16 TaxID=1279009 RepID=M7N5R5_9BACT|nr:WecB/TagA/CpsF family glycosyltransferase [Cesiribacter andamanensis]EMR02576.1 putative UDP-N-acetyl-D-mannosaminuronic acid transferase [Cesiribacter andamanensis AMV16]